jgi:maltooligosyltrehalose trehalohydrolase
VAELSVWAPRARRVQVQITEPDSQRSWTRPLAPGNNGWFSADVLEAVEGRDYGFLLDDDEQLLPDPRSRRQPLGVHGPSRFYADTFQWTDAQWQGHPLPASVIYELHIGTFTEEGTVDSAIDRLDYLADLGVTHVELLPVNDFNGVWNWGYDGVLWYAVHEAYGGPDGLKRFVDACHARGLAVCLDVVYNHLGASGNYLPKFGPYLKTGKNTWGDLINLDGEQSGPVRDYIIDNACMWLSEFHVDALRLDAVHALEDDSVPHLLTELSQRVDELATIVDRPLTLIAESDLNDPVMITPRPAGYGLQAQWDDDVHHCLHVLLSGEHDGYYADFGSVSALAKTLTNAFFHDGTYSSFRGKNHGKPVDRATTPGDRFVAFLQDHDQVGNRAAGDRLSAIAPPSLLKVGAVLLLTAPFTPMLWMGEEWAASTPWPFFTSHPEPDLGEAVRKGRLEEFAKHGWDSSKVPDPQDPRTFTSAKLLWAETVEPAHAELLETYRTLLRLRRDIPELADPALDQVATEFDDDERWLVVHRGGYRVVANFGKERRTFPLPAARLIYATGDAVQVSAANVELPPQSAVIVQIS